MKRKLWLIFMLTVLVGLWALSSPPARAACSASHNRVDDSTTEQDENTDDILVIKHGLVPKLGTDRIYGGGRGEENGYLGFSRDQGYIESSGGSDAEEDHVHGGTSDGKASLSVGSNGVCVNDKRIRLNDD